MKRKKESPSKAEAKQTDGMLFSLVKGKNLFRNMQIIRELLIILKGGIL